MRHGTSNKRSRNRNNNGGRRNNQGRSQVYDSNGPDVRIRGTAHQVAEKYLALAKDAVSSGNHVVAENYYQHAEHYIRIINEFSGNFDTNKALGQKPPEDVAEDEGNRVVAKSEDKDLGLPKSILGDAPVTAEKEAASETVTEGA